MNKEFSITGPATIRVKKDKFVCGKVFLAVKRPSIGPSHSLNFFI